jgi:hypothetical protein
VIADCARTAPLPMDDGGKVEGGIKPARWSLVPRDKYMWASVQTVRGCRSIARSVRWKTDGQRPRQRTVDNHPGNVVLRRQLRFIALATTTSTR